MGMGKLKLCQPQLNVAKREMSKQMFKGSLARSPGWKQWTCSHYT
jgi:hypothetical protein